MEISIVLLEPDPSPSSSSRRLVAVNCVLYNRLSCSSASSTLSRAERHHRRRGPFSTERSRRVAYRSQAGWLTLLLCELATSDWLEGTRCMGANTVFARQSGLVYGRDSLGVGSQRQTQGRHAKPAEWLAHRWMQMFCPGAAATRRACWPKASQRHRNKFCNLTK